MKIQKKKKKMGDQGGEGVRLGGQDGCYRRIEVFGKIHTKFQGGGRFGRGGGVRLGGGGGVRVDVNEELKFC